MWIKNVSKFLYNREIKECKIARLMVAHPMLGAVWICYNKDAISSSCTWANSWLIWWQLIIYRHNHLVFEEPNWWLNWEIIETCFLYVCESGPPPCGFVLILLSRSRREQFQRFQKCNVRILSTIKYVYSNNIFGVWENWPLSRFMNPSKKPWNWPGLGLHLLLVSLCSSMAAMVMLWVPGYWC